MSLKLGGRGGRERRTCKGKYRIKYTIKKNNPKLYKAPQNKVVVGVLLFCGGFFVCLFFQLKSGTRVGSDFLIFGLPPLSLRSCFTCCNTLHIRKSCQTYKADLIYA